MDFKIATHADLLRLRDLVVSDAVALEKWRSVVDRIVDEPADVLHIKRLLDESKYHQAILMSLEVWSELGSHRSNLREGLHELKLNSLADKIAQQFGLAVAACQIRLRKTQRARANQDHHRDPSGSNISKSLLVLICTGTSFCVLAMVSVSYFPSNTVSIRAPPTLTPAPARADPVEAPKPTSTNSGPPSSQQQQTNDEQLKIIRDLVIGDSTALQKWATIVDYIVNSPADELRIKSLLKRGDFEEAVLGSLRIWNASGDERTNLVQLLKNLGFNLLAGRISKLLQ